ncbi:hypothetical protein V7111_20390 [Neobacillus niacini]|uniref:hypothetical protein n=1 Tax=Neobacillus niacini TaxID=86668 RepID=UPI0030036BA9
MRNLKRLGLVILGNKNSVDVTVDFYSKTTRLVMGALLGSIAVILQSAGIFTGIGYIFSMLATGPIVLSCLLSTRIGLMTYIVTICLLAVVQPSELLVFPFTTGLLGLSIGYGLKYIKRPVFIVFFAAFCLTTGICILLYGIGFPVLGPSVSSEFNGLLFLATFIFSIVYGWIWLRVSILAFNLLHKVIFRRTPTKK